MLTVSLMQSLDHAVLSIDVTLYLLQIIRHLSKIFLFLPINRFLSTFGSRQDVFNGIAGDKVFIGLEAENWFFVDFGNWRFLMAAIVGKVSD